MKSAPIYGIPKQVMPGFLKMINLSEDQAKIFASIFHDMKVGESFKQVVERGIKKLDLDINIIEDITGSLFSLANIYFDSGDTSQKFSEDFANSFDSQVKDIKSGDLERFKNNLSFLVSSFGSVMRPVFKAQELIRENPNNYYESRVVSDIRIVYDEEQPLDKKDQLALVVHHLRIRYFSKATQRSEIFISLNLDDLHQLQKVINRAIDKDNLIRTKNHELTFIDPK